MSILQPLELPPAIAEPAIPTSDRLLVRVLPVAGSRSGALRSRRLIAADPGLIAVGEAAAADALDVSAELEPDVVVLDAELTPDLARLAHELRTRDRPPAVVVRAPRPEPLMVIAAIIAGVQGIVSREDSEAVLCDAIRWVADGARWLPDTPPFAVSMAGARVARSDVPILLMLRRGTPLPEIAAELGMSHESLDVRRAAMLEACAEVRPAMPGPERRWSPGTRSAGADGAAPGPDPT